MADVIPTGDPTPTPDATPIRVLLVDDDALVRGALRMMIHGVDDVLVVGEAADGSEVPAAVARHRPDVVLMDIRMPHVDGLAATEALRGGAVGRPTGGGGGTNGSGRSSGGTADGGTTGGAAGGGPTDGGGTAAEAPQVIVLTTLNADDQVLRALRAGAGGFLLKDTPPAEILRAIRLVASGEAMLSPAVTRQLIEHVTDPQADDRHACAVAALASLTDREREVSIAVGQGKSNAEIGAELYMSTATVKAHVSRILQKLDLNNRVQVALLAHDAGRA